MHDGVVRRHHLIELDREIVVEKERHAASACSKSTASRTEAGLIWNHRATSSTESFARALRAKTLVAMPSLKIIGWPKLRRGSRATCRLFPRGHHRRGTLPLSKSTFFRKGRMTLSNTRWISRMSQSMTP